MSRQQVEKLRRAYARQMLAACGISDNPELLRAFASVPRENFLGPPPFGMLGFGLPTPVSPENLDRIYRDVLFVLDAEKGINNGQPSLHALVIDALAVKPGDSIAHIGAGTGYYTAILAEIVGPSGHVLAVEADTRLGEMARANLDTYDNIEVVVGDGADYPEQAVDGVDVNFAVAAPAANWIEHLAPGGRLVFPLGVPAGDDDGIRYSLHGAMFLIERRGAAFAAQLLCPVAFVFGVAGAGRADAELVAQLRRAFALSRIGDVKSLIWRKPADPARCWFHSRDWSLSYDPPDGAG